MYRKLNILRIHLNKKDSEEKHEKKIQKKKITKKKLIGFTSCDAADNKLNLSSSHSVCEPPTAPGQPLR